MHGGHTVHFYLVTDSTYAGTSLVPVGSGRVTHGSTTLYEFITRSRVVISEFVRELVSYSSGGRGEPASGASEATGVVRDGWVGEVKQG